MIIALILMALVLAAVTPLLIKRDLSPELVESIEADQNSKFLRLPDGQRIHYQVSGEAGGIPVLLLHGFMASLRDWDQVAEELSEQFHVVRMDMPGMGLTGWTDHSALQENSVAASIEAILDFLKIDAVHLVGHSRGGYAAWTHAILYPERVRSLTLIASAGFRQDKEPRFAPISFKLAEYKAGKWILRWASNKAMVKKTLASLVANKELITPAWINRASMLSLRAGNRNTLIALRPFIPNTNLLERMHEIAMPTLLMWGQNDYLIPIRHAHLFMNNITGARLATVKNTGHYLPIESAHEVSREITEHIRLCNLMKDGK